MRFSHTTRAFQKKENQMAISSANFQKAKSNSVAETTREFEAKYLLPKEHRGKNEFYNCGVDEKILFNQEVAKAERKGGRIPKLENSLWEGVINLNKKHTIEDVNRVGEHIAKKFNLHYTRGALHRDEGHIDEKGKVQYNYHAHINFMTYKDGKQNWRLEFVNKEALREIQTEVAELLGMDRGELNSKSVRANHRHFRVNAEEIKAERIAVKETNKLKEEKTILKKENTSLKGQNTKNKNAKEKLKEETKALEMQLKELNIQLQSQLSNREQHAQREALVKELKEELKNKTLTTETMQSKFAELEEKLLKEKSHLTSIIEVKEIDILELKNAQITLKDELKEVNSQCEVLNFDKKELKEANKALQEQKIVLEGKVTTLEQKTAPEPNIVPQKEIIDEIQKIISEEFTKKEILESRIGKPIQAIIVKDSDSFLKRFKNIASQGVQSVANSVNSLKEEILQWKEKYNNLMEVLKSKDQKIADLEDKLQTISTKQQNQTQKKDHLEAIVEKFEVHKGNKSDSSNLIKSKEVQQEEISSKKRDFGRSR